MAKTTVLITGANRGIGRAIAEAYLDRPNHTVVAAVRDVSATTLKDVQPATGSDLVLVKIENKSRTDPAQAVEELQKQGITFLDVVIANAGINPLDALSEVQDIDLDKLATTLDINTFSFITLFKAVRPLLKAAAEGKGEAKLVAISSWTGRIVDMQRSVPAKTATYGLSKLGLNYLVRRAHYENGPWLTAWAQDPGFVQSDNGNATAKVFGLEEAPLPLDNSAGDVLERVDGATREGMGGRFWDHDGTELTL